MRMTLGLGGVASAIITLGFLVAVPSIGAVISGKDANPISTILQDSVGTVGSKVALAIIVFAFISAALSVQAMAVRLIYSYARDGMLVGSRALSNLHPTFHMPPGAVAVAGLIPAAITLLPSATVARIITFAVVGIYLGYASVTLACLLGRSRGWTPSGAYTLGRWGKTVNVLALVYGVATMIVLSVKTPSAGNGFFERWLVPVSVLVVAGIGLLYMAVFRPKEQIREDARAGAVDGLAAPARSLAAGPVAPGQRTTEPVAEVR